MRSTQPDDDLRRVQDPLLRLAGRVADEPGRPADDREHAVPRLLEATQRDELDEVAEVERRRGGVEAAVEGHRPGRHGGPERAEVGGIRDHPPPGEVIEQVGSAGRVHGRMSIRLVAPPSVPRGRLAATRATLRPRWPADLHLAPGRPHAAPSAAAPLRPHVARRGVASPACRRS